MYPRLATVPDHSFFLFGPRATGKTTWLRHHLGDALWFNLLLEDDYLPLTRGFVVYRGKERYRSGEVDGLPVEDFLSLIYTDSFYGDRLQP